MIRPEDESTLPSMLSRCGTLQHASCEKGDYSVSLLLPISVVPCTQSSEAFLFHYHRFNSYATPHARYHYHSALAFTFVSSSLIRVEIYQYSLIPVNTACHGFIQLDSTPKPFSMDIQIMLNPTEQALPASSRNPLSGRSTEARPRTYRDVLVGSSSRQALPDDYDPADPLTGTTP